jgi:hypothetical protein
MWQCDFVVKKVCTLLGVREFYPNPAWSAQQARNVAMFFAEHPEKPTVLLRDHDSNLWQRF